MPQARPYKGVERLMSGNYRALIQRKFDGETRKFNMGTYATPEEAAKARDVCESHRSGVYKVWREYGVPVDPKEYSMGAITDEEAAQINKDFPTLKHLTDFHKQRGMARSIASGIKNLNRGSIPNAQRFKDPEKWAGIRQLRDGGTAANEDDEP